MCVTTSRKILLLKHLARVGEFPEDVHPHLPLACFCRQAKNSPFSFRIPDRVFAKNPWHPCPVELPKADVACSNRACPLGCFDFGE